MDRNPIQPRDDWQGKVEALGLLYHQNDDGPYWEESAYYRFTGSEVDSIERATNDLHEMCLAAVQYVIDYDLFNELRIPASAVPWIKWSWEHEPPAIYGRFDLSYDGSNPPKLLEYNADTPTSLLEAAVVQWHWLQDRFPTADQFNSIWEALVCKWSSLRSEGYVPDNLIHFACADSVEDYMTITALRDTATEAGIDTDALLMDEIGWENDARIFVDLQDRPIQTIFKLYPWEWLVHEEFSSNLFESYARTQWMEPIWKMVLSNKGILPILWHMYKDHPNLLEAHFDKPQGLIEYVAKPILGREGANVTVTNARGTTANDGEYGDQRMVFQRYSKLPQFGDKFTVVGSWIIDGESHGIGIRESTTPITTNLSPFVPHLFD